MSRTEDNCMMHSKAQMLILGTTLGRRPGRWFGISYLDRLLHAIVFGQTGTGKSALLLNIMQQDIKNQQNFCLIDPHGDLARSIVSIAGKHCIYWDVADPQCPYGYNPLTRVSSAYRPLVVSGLIEMLKKQWTDAWGARMEHLLRFALLALLERPQATLQDIMPLFLRQDFQREVIKSVTDPHVRDFWMVEYPTLKYKSSVDGVASIANKLGAFLAHPVVRKAVCTPAHPLRFRSLMDEGTSLVVNLAKGSIGADISNVLGGMIVSGFGHAAYSRQDQAEQERRPFFLYIDEFPSFTTKAFVDMLSELRKYRLGLLLIAQYISRIDEDTRESALGNIGTLISFRVGATDADVLSKQFGGDVPCPRDLVRLANYEMFLRLMIDGVPSKPFSAVTLPPSI